jgi:hypothetical protein
MTRAPSLKILAETLRIIAADQRGVVRDRIRQAAETVEEHVKTLDDLQATALALVEALDEVEQLGVRLDEANELTDPDY